MSISKPASLAVSFQSADIPREQSMAASQNECPKLAYLWDRTVAVKKEFSGELICLRVASMNRPASLLDGDGWLASVTAVRGHQWDVRVWTKNLLKSGLFSNKADRTAAVEMMFATQSLEPDTWACPEPLLLKEVKKPTANSLG